MRNDLKSLGSSGRFASQRRDGRTPIQAQPDAWFQRGDEDEIEELFDLSGVVTGEQREDRRADLQAAIADLVSEKSELKVDLGRCMDSYNSGGSGKPHHWRQARLTRMEDIKNDLLMCNTTLSALRRMRLTDDSRSGSKLDRVAMHFLQECEKRLDPALVENLWVTALQRMANSEKITSPRLGFLAEKIKAPAAASAIEGSGDGR